MTNPINAINPIASFTKSINTSSTHLADIAYLKALEPAQFPLVNVKLYCKTVREIIERLVRSNNYDSSINETICRKLADCSPGNAEYSNALYAMLDNIIAELQILTCLNNQEKIIHMRK